MRYHCYSPQTGKEGMLLNHSRLLLELVVRTQRLALERVHIVRQEALESEDGALFAGEACALVEL